MQKWKVERKEVSRPSGMGNHGDEQTSPFTPLSSDQSRPVSFGQADDLSDGRSRNIPSRQFHVMMMSYVVGE